MSHIAIIGSGLAGLGAAHLLKEKHNITVFEKARGAGGRMSTRYADPYYFDHGAQYFIARDDAFQQFLSPFIEKGIVAEWTPRVTTLSPNEAPYKRDWFEPHYVATPNMNGLCKALLDGVEFHRGTEITTLERKDAWHLSDKAGETHGPFDWVICTAPAAQTHSLLHIHTDFCTKLPEVKMTGCYSLMVGLEDSPELAWEAAMVKDSPLGWVAVNSSKPGRNAGAFSLLAQTTNAWAEAHIDEDIPEMQTLLVKELESITGISCAEPAYLATHRWRYAAVEMAAEVPYLIDETNRLIACGDWCERGRVEAAFTSTHQAVEHLLRLC